MGAVRGPQYSFCPAAGAAGQHPPQVIRRGEGMKVIAGQANYQAILLAACPPGARHDIYLLLTQPGADRISHLHPSGSVEHIIIPQGGARVGLTEAPEELG